ncbi:15-hydroxyprostaglandin dehydrogenase [NAD(+)] [Holothuria leucospilota]|uniref:15-hydroxyprostaglandin dehydrogenase [NAD(+)] n=1 Tax=Holothuria leucospilota TaxID=206669 RepID=A0A9Q1BNT3_HOLLE|nr:15-hydroxyprostaglandin dehydrogenase [NAD(+)] [Holothuria leucospilota]
MKISGKVAIVTGGVSGIGKAVSLKLLENGAKLVAILDLEAESCQAVVSEFFEKFGADRVRFIKCDVTREDQLKNSFQEAYDVYGALDIVVNNAGIISHDNRRTIEVNLIGVVNAAFIAEKLMTREKRSERGIIINTASTAGLMASPLLSASYTASKHGVVGFTKSLVNSTDEFSKDLRVVAVCPDGVETTFLTRCNFQTEEYKQRMKFHQVENVFVSLDMVVDAFVLAIEDDSLHGAIIKVTKSDGIEVTNS